MSEEIKKTGPEAPPLKDLSKKHFQGQIEDAKLMIRQGQQQINDIQDKIQQQIGIINYATYILKTFNLPDAPKEEPKKKTDLEVK